MPRSLLLFLALASLSSVRAVENVPANSFNLTPPTSSDIPNWTSGWAQPTVQPSGYTSTTGWNYVGSVNGNSAVYLGNGWVITAAHVGTSALSLNNVSYPMVPNSVRSMGTTDLILFQVSPCPELPSLPLAASDPVVNSTKVAFIGWGAGGGNRNETWGYNTVEMINQPFPLTSGTATYSSIDFLTLTGKSQGITNIYEVVIGDSGGAAFGYNSTLQRWELAGLNEADGTLTYGNGTMQNYSGFVQLNPYAAQIQKITAPPTDTPALSKPAIAVLAALLVIAAAPGVGMRLGRQGWRL